VAAGFAVVGFLVAGFAVAGFSVDGLAVDGGAGAGFAVPCAEVVMEFVIRSARNTDAVARRPAIELEGRMGSLSAFKYGGRSAGDGRTRVYTGTCRSGIGFAMNSRRQGFARSLAIRSDFACRALSVAMPVLAYICR
jgi:hypothetical protein